MTKRVFFMSGESDSMIRITINTWDGTVQIDRAKRFDGKHKIELVFSAVASEEMGIDLAFVNKDFLTEVE
jgi:hypothetical protein